MTADTIAKELRDGLKGVTEGSWSAVDNEIRVDGLYTLCDFDGSVLSPEEDEANAAHFLRCHPENIAALLDHIEELKAERDTLRMHLDARAALSGDRP